MWVDGGSRLPKAKPTLGEVGFARSVVDQVHKEREDLRWLKTTHVDPLKKKLFVGEWRRGEGGGGQGNPLEKPCIHPPFCI